ncbi:MAG: T9SS type A sorting domain-containing protein [Ferruginibacter sp.]
MKSCRYTHALLPAIMMILSTCVHAQTEYLVRVDPTNGHIHKVDSISGVTWLRAGETPAYNTHGGWYSFFGGESGSGDDFSLISVYNANASLIWNPPFSDHPKFTCLQYGRNTDTLYGAGLINSVISLLIVDAFSGDYTVIKQLPGLVVIIKLIVDDIHNRFYLLAGDLMGGRVLMTIDMTNGNIISSFPIPGINNLVYDYSTNMFYAISIRETPQDPHPFVYMFCNIDPATGIINNITDLPTVANFVNGNETMDENSGRVFFVFSEWGQTPSFLYSIDRTTGNVINKAIIPQNGGILLDNMVGLRYDNIQDTLYSLYWEAHTAVMPLQLNKFDAILQDRSVVCNWQTLQEINSDHFEIERSEDGKNFIITGNVTATGNSTLKHDYRFTDANAASFNKEYLYYRLKMVDNDNRFSYSNTVKVKLRFGSALTIFPNPVTDHLSFSLISTENDNAMVLVTDISGKTVYKKEMQLRKGTNTYQLNELFLLPGKYTVSIKGKNNYSGNFIKL